MMRVALFLAVAGATRTQVTPIEKVTTMLKELASQVESDGDAEAATYNTYACFCKDKTDEKTGSIDTGVNDIAAIQADLDSYTAARAILDREIGELQEDIATYEEEVKNATAMRHSETRTFEEAYGDMTKAISALARAVATLKAGETKESLVAVKGLVKTAIMTAEALSLPVPASLLSAAPGYQVGDRAEYKFGDESTVFDDDFEQDAGASDYTFKSGDIIGTIETLHSQFRAKLSTLESDDAAAQSAFDGAEQAKKAQIAAAQTSLGTKEGEQATKTNEIAVAQADLTEKNSVLQDDRVYLKDLVNKCEIKSKEWEQRSTQRAGEIAAISQALVIIEGTVNDKVTATKDRGAEPAAELVQSDDYVNFVQKVVRKAAVAKPKAPVDAKRAKLAAILKAAGLKLKVPALSTLATRVAAGSDPFAKVKEMIQSMITRLLEAEAEEASHKGWCDKELAKVVKDRDYRLRDLAAAHTEVEGLNSRKEKLTLDEKTLTTDISNLTTDLATEQGLFDDNKAENTQTVADSKEGIDAIKQAIDVLAHFYGEAANSEVEATEPALLQGSGVDDEAPPSFSGAYKGDQSASTGILGMLDVILGDFERTVTETEAAQAQAKRDFVEFERTTLVSKNTKETALATTQSELADVTSKLATEMGNVRSQQKLLDTAVETWEELIPQCVVDPGMTHEERVAAREAEVEALKQAYCILNDEDAGCSGVFLQKRMW